jgi:diguanylate cyclase (GGDEF)-like protein
MRITEVDGLLVKSVDNRPAFDVYQRYLNIPNDQDFFLNALEFPFLIERDGTLLARVPVAVTETGALQFVADVGEGEVFHIGYGDLDLIVDDARAIHQSAEIFSPQAVFLYTCGCRRFLMQQDVELETLPFEAIAPTFGFYTYGEFFGSARLSLLNSTMLAVSLREGPAPAQVKSKPVIAAADAPKERDPYTNKHARVVSRLMRFIDAVTSELERSNREITKLSITDRLTQLVNRIRLEQVLDENLRLAVRYGTPLSVILLDIDHFKQVNDTFGHMVGDDVLVQVAEVLIANTRGVDIVGRWGGEEFMVVAPATCLEDAAIVADKLREAIDKTQFPTVRHITSSFGVASYMPGDDLIRMIGRADAALYSAKRAGRNRVELDRGESGSDVTKPGKES